MHSNSTRRQTPKEDHLSKPCKCNQSTTQQYKHQVSCFVFLHKTNSSPLLSCFFFIFNFHKFSTIHKYSRIQSSRQLSHLFSQIIYFVSTSQRMKNTVNRQISLFGEGQARTNPKYATGIYITPQ